MSTATTDGVFGALADPTRRQLMRHLAAMGSLSATEMTAHYPMTRQALAKHLVILAEAGLVSSRRHGREVLYQLTPQGLDPVGRWMGDLEQIWDQRLLSLQRHLKGSSET